jgi:hypothetical protein
MRITRHYLTIGGRRVHYRRCGNGPALLMAHQSPRSSAEYEPLMRHWGAHFTCIAPDTPGFGQSDPLPGEPDIDDFADATCAFVEAAGIGPMAAYGFHSGGIILVTAMRRRPDLFCGLAVGGYAIWTAEEMAIFGERYLPAFRPSAYGEHLIWLWNRMLEQSWFFPWFDLRDGARLSVAHADVGRVHAAVMEMLDAGDAYRAGYGAVLRAPRDIPPPDAVTPPVLISAYDGDPLQAHIDRLGAMPPGWTAQKVATSAEHQAISLDFLLQLADGKAPPLVQDSQSGFAAVSTPDFDGLIHFDSGHVDPPGHGLSDHWPTAAPHDFAAWQAVFDAFADQTGRTVALPALPIGDPDQLYPDLTPDRFGSHLTRAWGIARARALFDPWYAANAVNALPVDPDRLSPAALAAATLDILRARSAKALHIARMGDG